jgi:hypothetical protein
VAADLWGRLGASGLASARVRVSGVCALTFSGRTLSLGGGPLNRSRASGGPAVVFLVVLFCGIRRRAVVAWPLTYGVASARAGSRARAYGSPACARSDFPAGLYPYPLAVRCIVTAGPAVVLSADVLFAAGAGGGVAADLWGRLGASGLASARVWVSGVCALGLSGRTLSLSLGGPVHRDRRAGGCSFCGCSLCGRRRRRRGRSAKVSGVCALGLSGHSCRPRSGVLSTTTESSAAPLGASRGSFFVSSFLLVLHAEPGRSHIRPRRSEEPLGPQGVFYFEITLDAKLV